MFALLESLRSALESIRAHGFRSLLTSLGIIIGVASVIAVVSIVQGLSYTINAQFAGLGGNSLTIRSYTPFKQQLQGHFAKLRDEDLQLIARNIDGVSEITPILYTQDGRRGAISYRSTTSFSQVLGVGPGYLDVNGVYPEYGRFLTADDDVRRRLVCVVGVDVVENLEMPDKPIGEFFRVGNEWCKVVGVLEKRGELLGFSQDDYILLPYGTAKRIMNIMLVSVTERTREIGILKALGATRQDILLQFLIEALALTMIGGLVGVAIGYAVGVFVASLLPGFPAAHVPLWAVGLSFGFCAGVGVIFGIVPAAKAAQLNPIDALRYE